MGSGYTLVVLAAPLALLAMALAKTMRIWLPVFRAWPRWQRAAAALFLGAAVAWGGSKPGPTKANLRLLLAERAGRLSSGRAYAPKEGLPGAAEAADSAADLAAAAAEAAEAAEALLAGAEQGAELIAGSQRRYIRLEPAGREPDGTFFGELMQVAVTNGVAEAAVWFSLVPESAPKMRFNFASGAAGGVWWREDSVTDSFLTTYPVRGRECYLYYFPVPPELLDGAGNLAAPVQTERALALGGPGGGFNLLGALAVRRGGKVYLTVSGSVTNSTTGEVLYFDNGRLADPPARTQVDDGGTEL